MHIFGQASEFFLYPFLDRLAPRFATLSGGRRRAVHFYADAAARHGNNKSIPARKLPAALHLHTNESGTNSCRLEEQGRSGLGLVAGPARSIHTDRNMLAALKNPQ